MNPIRSAESRQRAASTPSSGHADGGTSTRPGSFREVLDGLVGQRVVLADPQSMEEVPVGHTLMVKITPAKILHCTEDSICIVRMFTHRSAKNRGDEPMRQWIPFSRIKGVSFRKDETVLHL